MKFLPLVNYINMEGMVIFLLQTTFNGVERVVKFVSAEIFMKVSKKTTKNSNTGN